MCAANITNILNEERLPVANNTNVLNRKECASRTLPRFYLKENTCHKYNILNERECASQTLHRFQMKENAHHVHCEREYEIIHTRSYYFLIFDVYTSSKFWRSIVRSIRYFLTPELILN